MLLMYTQTNSAATNTSPRMLAVRNKRVLGLTPLMEASEWQLQQVARCDELEEARVAQRILECPVTFLQWQHQHTDIIRSVAAASCVQQQKRLLLSATLSLLHRKSLFEYLRDYSVLGQQREMLLMHFHGGNDYARAMVSEHCNYLRSAASYLCSTYLGLRLLRDASFGEPLDEYATLYASYFATYSKVLLRQGTDSKLVGLAHKLKSQLGRRRQSLLNAAHALH